MEFEFHTQFSYESDQNTLVHVSITSAHNCFSKGQRDIRSHETFRDWEAISDSGDTAYNISYTLSRSRLDEDWSSQPSAGAITVSKAL